MVYNNTAISCSEVCKTFTDGPQTIQVLRNVNLTLSKGEMVSIVGPSGSGKTTLLHIIACLEKPTSGEIYIDGTMVRSLNDTKLSFVRRHKIGMIFQDFYLQPMLSALENVEIPMILDGVSEADCKKRAVELLSSVDLSNKMFHRPGELSSGEKQRVAFARSMANDPPIILADEPTGNLDSATGRELITILRSTTKNQKKTVLMVTHDIEAASNSTRVLLLRRGVLSGLKNIEIMRNTEDM